jgi:PiT family inorganic phosphate transporter
LPHDIQAAVLVALALAYAVMNGYNDAGAIVVGMLAGRALTPRQALAMAAVAELVAPLLFGSGVAFTVATGIVDPSRVDATVIAAAMLGAILWGLVAGRAGMPNSASHALVGGLVGAAFAAHGVEAIVAPGVTRVVAFLVLAPMIGLVVGYLGVSALMYTLQQTRAHPDVVLRLQRWSVVAALAFALGHGANNAQKSLGLIGLSLWLLGDARTVEMPAWAYLASAACLAAGVALGGQRILRTINARLFQLRTVHGLAAAAGGALVIAAATYGGLPISATQVASMAVAGAGAADRWSKVRWNIIQEIFVTWLVTIPLSALASGLIYLALAAGGTR